MVMAAASTARPMIWPPTRRVLSGNDADTSLTLTGVDDGDGSAEGVTCGKFRLGSVTGLGSRGSLADGSTPAGRLVPGSCAPTPAGVSLLRPCPHWTLGPPP